MVTLAGSPGMHARVVREAEHLLAGVVGGVELLVGRRERPDVVDAACQRRVLVERQEGHAALDRVLEHRRQHERPVHLERGVALLERQARGGLVGLGDRRIGAGRGGDVLDDLQRLHRGRAVLGGVGQRDGLAVVGEHLAAGTVQQRVEPHHQTLVLLGLHGDPARLARGVQPRGLGHHRVPVAGGASIKSARYQSNWVLVVIGAAYSLSCHLAVSSGPGSVLALRVGLGLACRIVGKRQCPTRFGELGGPHHVERHHVERLVVAGEPAGQLQPLIVGALGQAHLLDGEPAAQLLRCTASPPR